MTEAQQHPSWNLNENNFAHTLTHYKKNESLMCLANGYLSVRGSFEEDLLQTGHAGTYLNGLYEVYDLHYGEKFTGFPDVSQAMINLPDPLSMTLEVEGETLSLKQGNIVAFERTLDFQSATLTRTLIWENNQGQQIEIKSCRFISATHQHLACHQYQLTALNFSGQIKLHSRIALNRKNISREDDPRVGVHFTQEAWSVQDCGHYEQGYFVQGITGRSQLPFACHVVQSLGGDAAVNSTEHQDLEGIGRLHSCLLNQNQSLTLTQYICYDRGELTAPLHYLQEACQHGFTQLHHDHQNWWSASWEAMDIHIAQDTAMQQAIRCNLYHLTQSVGKNGLTNISAKGMTGEGYEGHYFWDTEIYMVPFFAFTQPEIAKQLLMYRYHHLDKARDRAKALNHHQGALFPWRTINGNECSAYYPAGTAQYHINADIAYAIKLYYNVTQDRAFMEEYGLELLLELSLLWMDVGVFDPEKNGAFCIQEVTGPDEYSCMVDNNLYTNVMVRNQMQFTLDCLAMDWTLSANAAQLIARFDCETAQQIIAKIYIPFSEKRQIHAQDDAFLSRPVWDIEKTPKSHFPLLMHYHPMVLYRHQVCKQADVVLAQLLLSDQFELEQKRRDYAYYAKITTHDSSLSSCIYGIMACELGDLEQSVAYFNATAKIDLEDTHHNTKDGIHAASMAGSWMGIVYGFAGLRILNGRLSFAPKLPPDWGSYTFPLFFQQRSISITVNTQGVIYTLKQGEDLLINHEGIAVTLTTHQPLILAPKD